MFPGPMSPRSQRQIAMGVFAALGLVFLVSTHAYLATRLVIEPEWPEPLHTVGLVVVALLCALLVAQPIGERTLRRPASLWVSWPAVRNSWSIHETSPDPGGLPRYPIKAVILVSFALLVLQGLSQVVKQVEIIRGGSAAETPPEDGDHGHGAHP